MRPIGTAALVLALAATARAETPAQLPVQGYLEDEALDEPVEGEHPIRFRLYAEAEGDDALWEETQPVEFVAGWFGVSLGAVTPLSPGLFERAAPLYLGVRVGDDDEELSPRSALGGAPYALHAATAGTVSDLDGLVEDLTGHAGYRETLAGPAGAAGTDGQQGPQGVPGDPGGPMHNLGLVYYDAGHGGPEPEGLLKITQGDGTDLGDEPPHQGHVRLPAAHGLFVTRAVTRHDHAFVDGTGGDASQIRGEPFGTTPGVPWPEVRPFFLYAVNTDGFRDGIEFCLSPSPRLVRISEVERIGLHGHPAATPSDEACFFLTGPGDEDVGDVLPRLRGPVARIGSVLMRKREGDDWTMGEFFGEVGIGRHPSRDFAFPPGQAGAPEGTWLAINDEGELPEFVQNGASYTLGLDGWVTYSFAFYGDGGADGQAPGEVHLTLPYRSRNPFGMWAGSAVVFYSREGQQGWGWAPLWHPSAHVSQVQVTIDSGEGHQVNLAAEWLVTERRGLGGRLRYKAF